jgi:hypothetical protein
LIDQRRSLLRPFHASFHDLHSVPRAQVVWVLLFDQPEATVVETHCDLVADLNETLLHLLAANGANAGLRLAASAPAETDRWSNQRLLVEGT